MYVYTHTHTPYTHTHTRTICKYFNYVMYQLCEQFVRDLVRLSAILVQSGIITIGHEIYPPNFLGWLVISNIAHICRIVFWHETYTLHYWFSSCVSCGVVRVQGVGRQNFGLFECFQVLISFINKNIDLKRTLCLCGFGAASFAVFNCLRVLIIPLRDMTLSVLLTY